MTDAKPWLWFESSLLPKEPVLLFFNSPSNIINPTTGAEMSGNYYLKLISSWMSRRPTLIRAISHCEAVCSSCPWLSGRLPFLVPVTDFLVWRIYLAGRSAAICSAEGSGAPHATFTHTLQHTHALSLLRTFAGIKNVPELFRGGTLNFWKGVASVYILHCTKCASDERMNMCVKIREDAPWWLGRTNEETWKAAYFYRHV